MLYPKLYKYDVKSNKVINPCNALNNETLDISSPRSCLRM